ncbi:MAG TPA: MFS transporter [Phycisphaerae bacterium]|nr:MFS transporter [Phycisphaerae bacterium]
MVSRIFGTVFEEAERLRGPRLRRSLQLVTAAWGFGAFFFAATGGTALPELAKELGGTPFFYGLLGAVPFLATGIQLPVCWIIERTRRRKWLFVCCVGLQRLLWLAVAALPLLLPSGPEWRDVRLATLLLVYFLAFSLGAVGNPTWMGWMADLIPPRIRGRYWAFRRRVGLLVSVPTALLSGWFIDRASSGSLGLPNGLAIVFTVAAICGTIDILLFALVPEIPKQPSEVRLTWTNLVLSPLRDRSFRRYLYFSTLLLFSTGGMIGHFLQRNLREVVQMSNMTVNVVLLIAPSVGWYLSCGWWGRACDRWGNRPVLIVASTCVIPLAAMWCLITPGLWWVGPLIPLAGGMAWSGLELASTNIMLGFAEGGRLSSYQAIGSIVAGIGGVCGPLLAGTIAQVLTGWSVRIGPLTLVNYHVLFLLSSLLRCLVVPLARRLEEPGARPARDVLRLTAGNVFNATRSFVLMPIRMVGWPVRATYRLRNGRGDNDGADESFESPTKHATSRSQRAED